MRARDGVVLLAGAVLGAGIVLAGLDRSPVVEIRSPPSRDAVIAAPVPTAVPAGIPATPDPVPAPPPAPSAEPAFPTEEEERRSARELALQTLELQLAINRLESGHKGAGKGKSSVYPGNPHAKMSLESLAEEREKAARIVEPLLEKWRKALPGQERAAAMKDMAMPMLRILETGGPVEHLVTLEEAAERGETAAERRWALIATHTLWQPPVVDFQLARSRSPHVEVRHFAVEGLAWVRGDEMPRAVEGVLLGLEDADPGVRAIAASSLAVIVADPARAPAILERLARETDMRAAVSMAQAVLELDPKEGRARVERAVAGADEVIRSAVEKALAAPK